MTAEQTLINPAALQRRISELEAKLAESEETLEAIRRGDVDAVVVNADGEQIRIYTLQSADRPYQVLIEQMQEGAVTLGQDGTVLYCNRRVAEMLGVPHERVVGQKLQPFVLPTDLTAFDDLMHEARDGGSRGEITLCTADGRRTPVYVSLSVLHSDGNKPLLCGMLTNLTEQKLHLRVLAEANARLLGEIAERERIEDALRQAQKMEAVGQLTGGLAHDFNNLLTGITGSLELLQRRIGQGRLDGLDRFINNAQASSKRAAAVTHRLLAFSRRQTLDPRPTDINRLVAEMAELIRRTVGPSVEMEVIHGAELWGALIDPSQLESALLNLCINARDAMPDGGRLTIETANRVLDDDYALELDVPAGSYIALCVTDTGCGMADEVIKRAFDPFFTTKPLGQGTGLGLSMIYGFARQSGGQISIYSEVDCGTTMCLHLPRYGGDEEKPAGEAEPGGARGASQGETVLVVDDEPGVRMLVIEALSDLGYKAIEASDGAAGLKVLQSGVRIDLLVTDVGLPGGINGRQVADAGRVVRPTLKVLFITGYAENVVFGGQQLEPGMQILTKPFTLDALGGRIRRMITEV